MVPVQPGDGVRDRERLPPTVGRLNRHVVPLRPPLIG
jgi:hypothetical protein